MKFSIAQGFAASRNRRGSREAAKAGNLKISSKLLRPAEIVD